MHDHILNRYGLAIRNLISPGGLSKMCLQSGFRFEICFPVNKNNTDIA